jgi:hypothetical protein
LEKYSDPAAWCDYMAIERACLKGGVILEHLGDPVIDITGGDSTWRRLWKKIMTARPLLVQRFVNQLNTGELSSTGFVVPIAPGAEPVKILASQWAVLVPDFTTSSAAGGGIRYEGIRVYEGRKEDADTPADVQKSEVDQVVSTNSGESKQRRAPKREDAVRAMMACFGPESWPEPNKEIHATVNEWLKKQNRPTISYDTLVRAMERRPVPKT